MSSFLGRKDKSRGIRNNNPGNLRFVASNNWLGKIPYVENTDSDKAFEQFTEIKYGIRAMLRVVINNIDKGNDTVTKIITRYAPPFENDTKAYISGVSKALGLHPDEKITNVDALFLITIARAIIKHEVGTDASLVLDSDIQDAIDVIGTFNLNNVTVTAKKKFKFNYLIIPVLLFFYTVYSVTV
ncbi:hypothetical protein ABXT06_04555 [Flavobacterium sp. UW10123]|uniref:hypothetical protein n=1 Tax=Flavobacterium sp. UW10123 TaxID=3230800 RepID=UPI0021887742|nr:hypothetical protein phicjt23_gp10 [Flavobacterium phage phiCjT23]